MRMIKSFRHKGLRAFFESGAKTGIQAGHADRLRILLTTLNAATSALDMDAPGWRLHRLRGRNTKGQSLHEHWSVWVNGNWRLTFYFDETDAVLVDYQDYH